MSHSCAASVINRYQMAHGSSDHSLRGSSSPLSGLPFPSNDHQALRSGRMKRLGRWIGGLLLALIAFISGAWASGALWFDAPAANRILAIAFVIGSVAVLSFVRRLGRKLAFSRFCLRAVLSWWLTIKPSKIANWQHGRGATRLGGHSRRRSDVAQRPQLRLPHRERLHCALGDAHRAHLADHRHRPRGQLLGLALDRASHRQFPIR